MVFVQDKPKYEAQVSQALIRLRRIGAGDSDGRTSYASARPLDDRRPIANQASLTRLYPKISLRQDGKRPRSLKGALLIEHVGEHRVNDTPELSATCVVRLYLGPDGTVTGQVHLEPGPDTPLRPVWHVKDVTSLIDIDQLINGAASAFSTLAPEAQSKVIKRMSDDVRASHPSFFARA